MGNELKRERMVAAILRHDGNPASDLQAMTMELLTDEQVGQLLDSVLVDTGMRHTADVACPCCGERGTDGLVWNTGGDLVRCETCRTVYDPEYPDRVHTLDEWSLETETPPVAKETPAPTPDTADVDDLAMAMRNIAGVAELDIDEHHQLATALDIAREALARVGK